MFARFRRLGPGVSGLCVLLFVLSSGCSDEGPAGGATPAPNVIGGFVKTTPGIAGPWSFTLSPGTDTCGIEFFPVTDEGVLRLTQTGGRTAFAVVDRCGAVVAHGEGVIEPSGVATFPWEQTFVVSGSCSLTLSTEAAGTSDPAGREIFGSYTLTVSPVNEFQSCGPTFPCTLTGAFAAQSCPPADCRAVTCGI